MLTKNLLVFPTNRAIRDYIANKKDTNQLLNKTISVGDFFSKVIKPKNKKIFIDNDLRILYLQEAMNTLDVSSLGIEKSFTKLFQSSKYLFKFFQELSHEYKTIGDIESFDTYQFYEEHLKLLKQIYINYVKILDENNYVDSITIANEFEINSEFLNYFENIMFFYEGYFSNFELEIINQVSLNNSLLIHLQINQFNIKNIDLFASLGFNLEKNNNYVLNISEKTVIESIPFNNKENKHKIFPVKQRLEQIGVIKKAIVDMVDNGIEPAKIVVILPDEKFYKYLKLFDNEKYFNFAMGNDIYNSAFAKGVKTLYDYLNNEEPKYKIKSQFVLGEIDFIEKDIRPFWNKRVSKELFFEIFNLFLENEKTNELVEKLLELKISLERLLFNQHFEYSDISLKDSFKIVLQKLASITLDDVKSGKVTVLGILETRLADFDGAIIVDFNDDTIPKRSIKDKFLSSTVKQRVGLPSPKERESLQKYYYKRVIDNVQDVVVTYVKNEEKSMSRFLNELFPKPNIVKQDFSSILLQNRFIQQNQDEIVLDIDLSKEQWSASKLKTYLSCRRKFYFQYLLNIKEHDISLEPKSYEIGNIIHKVLEDILKENPKYKYETLINELSMYQKESPYIAFELELWKKRLYKFYIKEQELQEFGLKPVAFEKFFKIVYNDITLTGRIDRLDSDERAKYHIYDYKTSKNLKIDTPKTYLNSTDFQLEFYYLASREFDVESVGYYDLYHGEIKKEVMLEEKLALLDKYLNELKTTQVSFDKCDTKSTCEYCPYKTICNR